MTHWGWYWRIKRQHTPKKLCSQLMELDSFKMFRDKEFIAAGIGRCALEIPAYNLIAVYMGDKYQISFKNENGSNGVYDIAIERKPCNYGGYYYFFNCPSCNQRIRKLYCFKGAFLCRKCLNLGYYSQRLRPVERYMAMADKIEDALKNKAGDLYRKPPWIKYKTYAKLKERHFDYLYVKSLNAMRKEMELPLENICR